MPNSPELFPIFPLGKPLSILTKLYVGVLTKNLEHLEVERHFSVLILIEKTKCSQQFLSDKLMVDKASMVRIIDAFVKKNYLKRTVNPNDRREHWMELTSKAKKIMPDIHNTIKVLNGKAFKGLTKKQIDDFYNCISCIYSNLSKEPANKVVLHYKKKN